MLTALAVLLLASPGDEVWPDYRGPTWDGHAPAGASPPLTWSEEENVAWKVPVRGRGWSTPVVWDGVAWLTSATPTGTEQYVMAVDVQSGEVLRDEVVWEIPEPEERNALNSYASPSPVAAGGRVFLHFGTYGTLCIDTSSGERLWERRDLNCDHMEGPGSSPILWEDLLIVHLDGGDQQYVVALEQTSGETVWRTDRRVKYDHLPNDLRKAYSTPIVVRIDGAPQLVSSAAEATFGYDPRTGEQLWRFVHKGFSMSSRPVYADGIAYLNTGFMSAEMRAVRLGGEGELGQDAVAWHRRRGLPKMSSPVLEDGHMYLVSDGGTATCLDAATGDEVWRKRLDDEFCASPVLADGRLYFCGRHGTTTVIAAKPKYEVLAVNELDAGSMASPIVLGDALLIRTETHLYRIAEPRADG